MVFQSYGFLALLILTLVGYYLLGRLGSGRAQRLWLLASLLLFVRANQRVQALEEEKARLSELMWAVSQGETLTEEEKELVFSGRYSEIDGELYGGRRSGAYWQQRRALASTALSGFLLAVCLIEALRRTLYQNDDP